ncbi:MAG: cytochrome ubiquinol oxidase subunit I [Bdellovibrionia bacterium]
MDNLIAARSQMALSLGFHIIFAAIGIAMPFLMATSHGLYLRLKDEKYRTLTQAWSKGVAIFFAVGAVSGTLLSFELGLLWPKFMEHAGPIIGMPFSLEGTAFFLEAIALGIFLYGWDKINPWTHWASGLVVGLSGLASAFFVICANGWMNSPAGFDWNNGNPINIDPWAAMFNDAAFIQGLHMVVAAFEAVGFAVAGIHAALWIKTKYSIHKSAVKIAFIFGATAALVQPLIGHVAGQSVARRQPIKLAAMEGLFETQRGAPFLIGGWPDVELQKTRYGLEIPKLLSFIAYADIDAEVKGLKDFPRDQWPPVPVTHFGFQIMVGLGTGLALVGLLGIIFLFKRPQWFDSRNFLKLLIVCTPLGFIALEAGWIVTEVGRQPWIIYKVLRTADALTPRTGIVFNFIIYAVVYFFLAFVVTALLVRQTQALHRKLSS